MPLSNRRKKKILWCGIGNTVCFRAILVQLINTCIPRLRNCGNDCTEYLFPKKITL
jgi:hypothetical protein